MNNCMFFLLAGAPIIAAIVVAVIFRKPEVSLLELILGSGLLLFDTKRYLTPLGRRLFWGSLSTWLVVAFIHYMSD